MSDHRKLAGNLTNSLELALPPVAVAFSDDVPSGVAPFDGAVPAGCTFWEKAAARVFATSAADHELCAIGVHTHNLAAPSSSHAGELQEALKAMAGLDYVRAEEVTAIPFVQRRAKHVIYGPLADFPIAPEVVLLFAHARQGLIISEAAARVDGGAPAAMGRPACAVIPQVVNRGNAALSLGCCGARAYIGAMSDAVALWALPAAKLDRYGKEIQTLAAANQTLATFHARRKEDVDAGKRPTVRESLARLSS
jgi:uncharacterized protein (DUF169 family)